MSQTTSIEGLYIIRVNKRKKMYDGHPKNDVSCIALRNEITRLHQNPLIILEQEIYNFISSKKGLSIISFNCQRLHAHANDLTDRVMQNSNICPASIQNLILWYDFNVTN